MPRTEAKPLHEEPDAVVPHVRICGGPGEQSPGLRVRGMARSGLDPLTNWKAKADREVTGR